MDKNDSLYLDKKYDTGTIDFFTSKIQDIIALCEFLESKATPDNRNRKCCFSQDIPENLLYLVQPRNSLPYVFYRRSAHICVYGDWQLVVEALRSGIDKFLRIEFEGKRGDYRAWFWGHTKMVKMYGQGQTKQAAYTNLLEQFRDEVLPEERNKYFVICNWKAEAKRVLSCKNLR